MEDFFEIEELVPTGVRDVWRARVKLTLFEMLDGVKIANEISLAVRVSKPDDTPVAELLDAAYAQCITAVGRAEFFLKSQSLSDIRAQQRADAELDLVNWGEFNEM